MKIQLLNCVSNSHEIRAYLMYTKNCELSLTLNHMGLPLLQTHREDSRHTSVAKALICDTVHFFRLAEQVVTATCLTCNRFDFWL
jgi:hypothetical protein